MRPEPVGDLDELALVRRAVDGDVSAFAQLVRIHEPAVLALAGRLSGDPDAAADIAQEAMIRAWKGIGRFRGESAVSTWLYRITVNTAWTHRRRAQRRRLVSIENVELIMETEDSVLHPERRAESAALGQALGSALSELPMGTRTVVVLKDVYGWAHAEIAEALGISVTATKVRLHRGRRRLQERLGGEL